VDTSLTTTLSTEGVQTFLQQVEAQLLSSEAYHQLLTALQNKLGGIAEEFQSLVAALGREAIQSTIHQLLGAAPAENPAAESAESAAEVESAEFAAEVESAEQTTEPVSRSERLVLLGQQIKIGREAKGLTVEQLHLQTYVPLHHLKALEVGAIDRLPEDVFLRGFVRQLEKALGVSTLAGLVPAPEVAQQQVVPGWKQKAALSPVAQISPVHLYVGYAALMAGAVGGLTWISQPPQSEAPGVKPSPHAARSVKAVKQALAQSSVAVPEMMPNR
jgi:cytoskeleton protein RodZ